MKFHWSGCLFWIALVCFLILIVPGACSVPIVSDVVEADRERAAADRAGAETMASLAEAEKIEADAAKVVADANAYTVRRYTDAGVAAIETDRKEAHKMIWLTEIIGNWIGWIAICCGLPINLTCLVVTFAVVKKRQSQS